MNQLQGEAWITSPQKRRMDIMFALGALPLATPACLGAAALIKIIDGYNPWFSQPRHGLHNEPFIIRKLRTMPPATAHNHGAYFNDPRATSLGKIFRNTRIDELPQVINVLRGEMSVAGLRPLLPEIYMDILESLNRSERKIWTRVNYIAKPGYADRFNVHVCEGRDLKPIERYDYAADYLENASFEYDMETILDCARVMGRILLHPMQRHRRPEGIPDYPMPMPELAATVLPVERIESITSIEPPEPIEQPQLVA